MNDNKCVICGAVIPEGRMVCPICETGEDRLEHKRDLLYEYCYNVSCDKCVLNNKTTNKCLRISVATEDELDNALKLIKKGTT